MEEITALENKPGFWEDAKNAAKLGKEKSLIQEILNDYEQLHEYYDEFEILEEYAVNDDDEESAVEAIEVFEKLKNKFITVERNLLFGDEVDSCNAIISINAGAGGTESCDWASMLHRMVTRWAESKKFKIQILDHQVGDVAGIKSITFMVIGNYAYGLLKSETGIHRLVRISPFDSNSRRHTSFASIFVGPEIDEDIEIEIHDKDIKIDVYRSGGAGGQSVNTTDSAVRITHLPTGIIVTCQNERSQFQNKNQAMKVLRSRLYEKAMEEKKEKENELQANKKEIGWGSQIRSYVLHPYKMVKDHRTNYEMGAAERVLDGDLDGFMDAYLRWAVNIEDN